MPFTGTVKLEQHPDQPASYRTLADITWTGSLGDTVVVPAGSVTDLASVPRSLTWLVPVSGVYSIAAIVHDHACILARAGALTRRDADGMFRLMLRELGVPWVQRNLMWAGVRYVSDWSDATWVEVGKLLAWSFVALVAAGPVAAVVWTWLATATGISRLTKGIRA